LAGDSKVIINWFTNYNNIQVISLQPWMTRIRLLSKYFQQIKVQHIYKNYNDVVDRLSKEALLLDEGGIYISKESYGQHEIFERINVSPWGTILIDYFALVLFVNYSHKEDINAVIFWYRYVYQW